MKGWILSNTERSVKTVLVSRTSRPTCENGQDVKCNVCAKLAVPAIAVVLLGAGVQRLSIAR